MEIDLSKPLPDEVVFILRSKAYEFQRDGVEKIVAQDIEDYLMNSESGIIRCNVEPFLYR